jgi:hypothetical protein
MIADYTIRGMAAVSPTPNQGAMVMAFLAFAGATTIAVVMVFSGLLLIVRWFLVTSRRERLSGFWN